MAKKNKKAKVVELNRLVFYFGLVVIMLAVAGQVMLNIFLWQVAQEQAAFKIGSLIGQSIDNLNELKTDLGADGKIEEMKLQLPAWDTDDFGDVKYLYSKAVDSDGVRDPSNVQVTSTVLTNRGHPLLISQRNVEDVFDEVPTIQACSRGFLLQFEPLEYLDALHLSGTKNLSDGRTLYVYRETACNAYGANELESYLLGARAY